MKTKNKLRNAIIKALGGFTEDRNGPENVLPAGIIGNVRSLAVIEVKSMVRLEAPEVSDLRLRALMRQHLAEELDRQGFITYGREDRIDGIVLGATILVAAPEDRKREEHP